MHMPFRVRSVPSTIAPPHLPNHKHPRAMDDDYRQPSPYSAGIFADSSSDHINECIARIEALKFKVLGNSRLADFEQHEFLSELNTLRAAYLHLCTLSLPAPAALNEQMRPAVGSRGRANLELEGVLGANHQIAANLDRIARIAPSQLTVLLEGETGSGKELFARIIHLNSKRDKFVAVNCGALPSGVIESELFGHSKGAFTGATADRKGRFEEANGGTIFLDEVGELEPLAQVKLLRTLDVGEIQRVGSDKVTKVDVRVIAATNRNLEQMVSNGTFREDLFFRLNICHLLIPPLRERRDEIQLLLEYFIRKVCADNGIPVPTLDPELKRFLVETYHYPGNIRELRNLGMYIAHIFDGRPVRVADLPQRYTRAHIDPAPAHPDDDHRVVRDRAERSHLSELLLRHSGDIKAVCAALDLSRARLYQLLKKHHLRPDEFRQR
ncbi:sigma 54-interacting transcriptional regulator [Skermanella sp. TT6]|uniref:Sigma 54-interacting transcriptional regulator n=1 Tax=Skermanella cutis TaxID=2775420 RepID=A0ABX7BCJ9_9PROT|nr:sigma 54-interacting transcriptional regulator [Skermanella sp. TT6]QQP91932.1 sigma 54-interacting transcriptional regulator [Skermanella sp. TT6]